MLNELKSLAERVVEHLGVELIPIEFDSTIQDDSRLVLKPVVETQINSKFQDDYFERVKTVTHEYRYLFQILWASLMKDERAMRWKKAFKNLLTSENANILSSSADAARYASQEIELDAFAFIKYYLEEHGGMKANHPSDEYKKLIRKYIEAN